MQPASRIRRLWVRRPPGECRGDDKTNLADDAGVSANKIKELISRNTQTSICWGWRGQAKAAKVRGRPPGCAQRKQGQAKTTLEGTKRLFEKGFVTKIDMERDEIAAENNRLKVQTAETARDLFMKYEFPKAAEESLSKYAEAVRELDQSPQGGRFEDWPRPRPSSSRPRANTTSSPGSARSFTSNRRNASSRRRNPGLVVYGGGGDEMIFTVARSESGKGPPFANASPSSPFPT